MNVFVDKYALVAWFNAKDANHARVSNHIDNFRGRLITTEWILLELADAFASPPAHEHVVRFIMMNRDDPQFDIVPYDQQVFQAGFDLFEARPDKAWTLTDCISFTVMTARGLTDALTADRHFIQAGFHAVFAPNSLLPKGP